MNLIPSAERYTLPRVLEIVRGHAEALGTAGKALEATEGEDPEVLAIVGHRALKAATELWDLEQQTPVNEEARTAWEEKDKDGDPSPLWYTLWALPTLAMAVEFTATNPQDALSMGRRWTWCEFEAQRIAKVLMAWVKAHEKENGAAAGTVSQPEEPERSFELAWVITMMKAYADAFVSAATALNSVEGEDTGILSLLAERARAAARVLWNIEGGEGSLHRTSELTEAWEAHKAAKLMQRILWQLPLLELGAEAAGAGGYDRGSTTPWLACVTAAENVAEDMRGWVRAQEKEASS